MGMYTEIVAGFSLKPDTPESVVGLLKVMCGEADVFDGELPDHPLFRSERWRFIGRCSSYYFGFSSSYSTVRRDSLDSQWIVSIRASIKNYGSEIGHFFDWITSYVESGSGADDLLGYSMYEESDEPVLYYATGARRGE